MPILKTLHKARVPVHIFTEDVDSASMTQLAFLAKHRQVNKTWKKCQNPAIYHMANHTKQS